MKHTNREAGGNDAVAHAQKAYREILARWGLQDFTQEELNHASAMLRAQKRTRIHADDIEFQAAFTRLESRSDLDPHAVEQALKQLLEAEYECDQAQWERDCHNAAVIYHSHLRLPDRKNEHEVHEHELHEHKTHPHKS
jgi:hypothetical protein